METTAEILSVEHTQAQYLSKFKKFVCKLFKITPEQRYYADIKIKPHNDYIHTTDMVLDKNGIRWYVTANNIETVNMKSITHHNFKFGDLLQGREQFFVYGSAQKEG